MNRNRPGNKFEDGKIIDPSQIMAMMQPQVTCVAAKHNDSPHATPIQVDVLEPHPNFPHDPLQKCMTSYVRGGFSKRLELVKHFGSALLIARGRSGEMATNIDDKALIRQAFQLAESALEEESARGNASRSNVQGPAE